MGDAHWIDVFEGPRWLRIPKFLKDECWERHLKIEIEVDKGLIRETVRFDISGPLEKVERLKGDAYAAIQAYLEAKA
jgi:hypothetical protein